MSQSAPAFIQISTEMTVLLGPGVIGAPIPKAAVEMAIETGPRQWTLRVDADPNFESPLGREDEIVFLVSRDAMQRLGGSAMLCGGPLAVHLSADLRAIALAFREPIADGEARIIYQLAKAIEFVCDSIRQYAAGALAPVAGEGLLSAADTRRMIAARQLIDEHAHQKLSLDFIARSCGLNRSKLTRGFKALFACTVSEAIAERRLELASRKLLTTDLPISSIGYESGYQNNASFARAFGRRFGRSPSDFRCRELAA